MAKYHLVALIFACMVSYIAAQGVIGEIPLPSSQFDRIILPDDSFGHWIRNQPLKKPGSDVLDYRDRVYKHGTDSTVAYVMDIDISGRRMEQCMDILIRLFAGYLWDFGKQQNITFPLPGGFWLDWQDWQTGGRPEFNSINVTMIKSANPDSSRRNLESYLRTIYAVSHTQQFYHAYPIIDKKDIQVGDFIVSKGSKSHAIMITDLARDSLGNYIALIGHGDTPACQFYLLKYNEEQTWFPLDFNTEVLPLPIRRKMRWSGLRRFSTAKVDKG